MLRLYYVYETPVYVACTLHRVRDDCTRLVRASRCRSAAVGRSVYRRALSSRLSAVGLIHHDRETAPRAVGRGADRPRVHWSLASDSSGTKYIECLVLPDVFV